MSTAKKTLEKPISSQQANILIAAIEKLEAKLSASKIDEREYAAPSPRNKFQSSVSATQKMFDALRDVNLHPSTRDFINSLEGGFLDYGSLTQSQLKCLTDNYNWFINEIPFSR